METINERFKILRKECNKTQAEWGKILGIQASGISDIEKGRRNVTEQHLTMLSNWKERIININWLQTGEGEMLVKLSEEDEIISLVSKLLGSNNSTAFYILIKDMMRAYVNLDSNSKKTIDNFCSAVCDQKRRED